MNPHVIYALIDLQRAVKDGVITQEQADLIKIHAAHPLPLPTFGARGQTYR